MNLLNTIFLIVGIGVTILGAASFFIPALTRFINAPGNPKIKSIISIIIGIIIIIISFVYKIPVE